MITPNLMSALNGFNQGKNNRMIHEEIDGCSFNKPLVKSSSFIFRPHLSL